MTQFRPELLLCILDGLPIRHHTACVVCGILIGPAHKEKSVNDRGVCPSCAMFLDESYPVARWDQVYEVR
jgi:hypothetical protein